MRCLFTPAIRIYSNATGPDGNVNQVEYSTSEKVKATVEEESKLQTFVFYKIRKNTPMSSKIHRYVKFKSKWNRKRFKEMQKVKKCYSLFTCVLPSSLFTSHNHRINYCKFKLSSDIEKNPGPIVDPSKTIRAPYSQGNFRVLLDNSVLR